MDKAKIVEQLRVYLLERIARTQHSIDEAIQSRNSDTKSSAGDKHETGRAMVQLEIEKLQRLLGQTKAIYASVDQIDPANSLDYVTAGALIGTESGTFLIGPGLGKVELEEGPVFCVSMNSPVGQAMSGLEAGGEFQLQTKTVTIDWVK